MSHLRPFRAALGALLILAACDSRSEQSAGGLVSRSWNPAGVKEVDDVPIETFKAELAKKLATRPAYATDEQWGHVKKLYAVHQNAPLWMDDDGVHEDRADALVDALVNATTDGIAIDQYPLMQLASMLDTLNRIDDPQAQQLAEADVLMTTAYVSMAEDYFTGQVDPTTVAQSWHIDTEEQDVDSALVRSLREKKLADAFVRMRPGDKDYELLRQKLGDYRRIASAGGWKPIPAGKALKRGDTDSPERLALLRARLQAEGIKTDGDSGNVFGPAFAAGIALFQHRHSIGVDSMLGKETLDALNVPATFRVTQIAANLERYRWLPRALGERYVFVNVPAFKLEGYEGGKKTIEMKVIVGAEYDGRSTPVFSDRMETVVFRPYWEVPEGIAQEEIIPGGIPADFEMTTLQGRPHLRQRPGPKNALGLVKFLFPNDFNIYLHDTPGDNLFKKDVRAMSHGCIRLEKPEEMAQWVLGWDAGRVREAMHNGPDNRAVRLPTKIPVYIAYMTTFVRDGHLYFGNDVYGRDDKLTQAVVNGALPTGEAVRAVDALRRLIDD